ncbi:MAG: hypothetical protein V3R95_06545 [Dehalococcoidia bacterium]
MIIVRETFEAKYGRGDELIALIKEGSEMLAARAGSPPRILSDLSGQFFTIQMETEMESLSAFEESQKVLTDPRFGPWFERMVELVETGRRDFFHVEE